MNQLLLRTSICALLLSTTSISAPVFAAVPQKLKVKTELFEQQKHKENSFFKDAAIVALRLPMQNRIQALKKYPPEKIRMALEHLAKDPQQTLQVRWRAITGLASIQPKNSSDFIDEMLQRQEWFLRNAATIALTQLDRQVALQWSTKLLSDPALVVRTAAVDVIEEHRGVEAENQLWKKLYSQENFRNGKSLWIRKRIAKTLVRFASPGEERQFIRLLQDKDPWLHKYGVEALEKITGYEFAKGSNLEIKRKEWLAWAGHKN